MATSFALELKKRASKNGKFPIYIRIIKDRKVTRIKTSIELSRIDHWEPKRKRISTKEPNAVKWNDELEKEIEKLKQIHRDLNNERSPYTTSTILNVAKREQTAFSFLAFAKDYSNRTLESGDYRTYTKYITFINKLLFFINGITPKEIAIIPKNGIELEKIMNNMKNDLFFHQINLTFLNKFKAYLHKIPNSKHPELGLHPNTISKQFDYFKSLYNKGRIELKEQGLILKENPFENFSCETIDTNKNKLTIDEIETLKNIDLDEGSLLWHTRNCFMFAFYCAGMRAGDLIQLRGTDIIYNNGTWRLHYRMDKTSAFKDILLLPEAINLIRKYVDLENRNSNFIFPLLDNEAEYAKAKTWEEKIQLPYTTKKYMLQQINAKNSLLNKYLKKIAQKAGISKKITMHIARHSFANIARQKKANVYDISKALGHSSLKITENYLSKFDTTSQDETMKLVLSDNPTHKEDLLHMLKAFKKEEIEKLLEEINS